MKPILFAKNATTFTSYGLGVLSDAIKCEVTEERNGAFELEMQYPTNGIHFGDISEGAIIVAKPSEAQGKQAFRIYKITEPFNEVVTICAEHISYALKYIPVLPYTANNLTEALAGIVTNSAVTNPFTFHTDKTSASVFTLNYPKSARGLLGGESGSILQKYKGEYKFDNYDVYLLNSRGQDNGVTLRYGKNITDFTKNADLSDTVTGVLPYYKNETDLVVGDISSVQSDLPMQMIATVDVTSSFNLEAGQVPTKAQVTAAGLTALNNRSYVGVPNINFKIKFVDLAKTEEYKDIAPLERVNLCDTVTIIFEKFGIKTKSKVIKTVYDCILERYNEIEVGDAHYSIATAVAEQGTAVKDVFSRIEVIDERITLKVSKGTVSSEISIESGQVTFNSNRLVVNSTNFSLDEDGNATFGGDITSSATIRGSDIIGATITGGTISGATITSTGTSGGVTSQTKIENGYVETSMIRFGPYSYEDATELMLSNGSAATRLHTNGLSTTGSIYCNSFGATSITMANQLLELKTASIPIAGGGSISINYVGW